MIEELNLEPHPEGGYYRRTYTSPTAVGTTGGNRPAVTLIHFWLPKGDFSAWHLVSSDEIWLWHGPGALQLQFGGSDTQPVPGESIKLASPGQGVQQALVPGGVWQRTIPGEQDVLVSCLVTPGFDFEDFQLADD